MDDDQERVELQSLMNVIPDEEEVAVDAIPLATKPTSIMLRSFDREDLETLCKLVKAKHGYTRPEEGYERVLWGDLKTMFKHHVEGVVWRNLRESKVLVWKLFDSCGVHFMRFQNLFLSSSQCNSRINEVSGSILLGRIVRIKRLLDDLRVTAVKLMLLVYKLLLLVFKGNAAGIKLQLLKDYNC
ncbi:hypothetical protein Tco_0775881 [Tanacetum coccineum]